MRELHLRVVRLTAALRAPTVTAFSQSLGVVYCPKHKDMPSNNEMAAKQLRMLNATLSILRVSATSLTLVQKSAAVSKKLAGILVNLSNDDEGAELFAVLLTQTFQWAPDRSSEADWDDASDYVGADILFSSNDKLKDLIVSLETLQAGYKVLADRPLSASEALKATEAEKRRVQAVELRKQADDLCAEAEKIASGVPVEDEAANKDYEDTDARDLLASIREKKRKVNDVTAAQTQAAQKELELMLGNTQQLAAAAPSGNSTLSGTSLWSAPDRASASKQTFAQIEEGKIVAKPSVRMSERDWAEQTRQWADRNFGEDRAGRQARRQYEAYVDAMYRQIPVYGWQAVHDFDMDMRRDVAVGKYEGWDEYKMQTIFWTRNPILTPPAENGPGKGGAGKAKGKTKSDKSVSCRDWNRGNCSRSAGSCRFAHKCSTCGGDHKVANCTRGAGRPPPPQGGPAPTT